MPIYIYIGISLDFIITNAYIYILQLEDNKYYVGKTNRNADDRILEHVKGKGSKWTQLYKPVKVLKVIPDNDKFAEEKYTYLTMEKYGPDNVRGGTYTSPILTYSDKKKINDVINLINDDCFKCGKKGHFANRCPTLKVEITQEEKNSNQEERLSGKKRPREEPQTSEAGLDVSSPVLLGSEPPCSTATSSVRPQTSSEEEPQPSEAADEPPTKWLRSSSVEPCDILLGLENH